MDMNCKNISIATVLLLVAACSAGTDGVASEPKAYADMTFEERALFMNDVVLPHMKETFTAFDPKLANMSCETCHGEGVSTGSYAMPSRQVPRLPASEEEFLEYVKDPEHGRWSQFMMDKVWPEMASLLKVKMFDPQTQVDGFSCHNCHKVEGEH
jgi:hypothetical protein